MFVVLLCWLTISGGALLAQPTPAPAAGPPEFTVTAGNAFFDATPTIGVVCAFDFGDPAGAYNVLAGYNAAHIYQTPGDYTLTVTPTDKPAELKIIHVVPDHRAVLKLDRTSNFLDVARVLQNDTVVLLEPGGAWNVPAQVSIKARNVEFRASGAGPKPILRRLGPTKGSFIITSALDTTFRGIEFDSDCDMKTLGNAKVNYRGVTPEGGHTVLVDCTFRNFDDAIFCTPMTRGVLAQTCTFTSEMRSCDVWADGTGIVLLGCSMASSQREHNVRSNNPHFYNMLVHGNDITNLDHKETLTFRDGIDFYVAHNALHTGWVRTGPGPYGQWGHQPPMTPDLLAKNYTRHVVFDRNAFFDGSFLQINEGSTDVTFRYNRFEVGQNPAVHMLGPSVLDFRLQGNYRVLPEPTRQPMVQVFRGDLSGTTELDSSTKTIEQAESLKGK